MPWQEIVQFGVEAESARFVPIGTDLREGLIRYGCRLSNTEDSMTSMRAAVFIVAAIAVLVGVRIFAQGGSTPLNNVYLPILLEQGFELKAVQQNQMLYLQKGSMLYSCAANYQNPCIRIGATR